MNWVKYLKIYCLIFCKIQDGETEADGGEQWKYCTSEQIAGTVKTTGPFALVRFHSDESSHDIGFSMTFSTARGKF